MGRMRSRIFLIVVLGVLAGVSAALAPATGLPVFRPKVTAMVTGALPSVVSIASRRIAQDEFNKRAPGASMGSGVIVDAQGYILTNEHVIRGATAIKVTLTDGRTFRGALVGADRFTDLAVVKIEGTDLKALPLGDASRLRIGDPVVAIGSPLWIEGGPTVTTGVISGKGRSMEEPDDPEQAMLHDLLQTDAAINPGNSGGPLLNLAGQIVGINTAIMESAHGIGFVIPVNSAEPIYRALRDGRRFVRPSLGFVGVSMTPQLAFVNDAQVERGTLVVRVEKGGPAAQAGLRSEDVILAVDDKSIGSLHDYHEVLLQRQPGDRVSLSIWRAGEILRLMSTLVEERS
jgi:serine protease Do